MTREQFDELEWRMTSHLSMADMHQSFYIAKTPFFTIGKRVSVPFKDGQVNKNKKTYTDYSFNRKSFDSVDKLLSYINRK